MGELERRRGARDLWISHGHVIAAALGVAMLSGLSFGTGWSLGRVAERDASAVSTSFTSDLAGDQLVQLLARVETAADLDGGVGQLTFPDELSGVMVGPSAPLALEGLVESAQVLEGHIPAGLSDADIVPEGVIGVVVARGLDHASAMRQREALRLSGHDARATVRTGAGALYWDLNLVFEDEAAAAAWTRENGERD